MVRLVQQGLFAYPFSARLRPHRRALALIRIGLQKPRGVVLGCEGLAVLEAGAFDELGAVEPAAQFDQP